jgi:hypothetical protein
MGCAAGQTGTTAACTGSGTTYDWTSALAFCEGLTWAGLDDWRLPGLAELSSIADRRQLGAAIDGGAFPGTLREAHWSSAAIGGNAWQVNFDGGLIQRSGNSSTFRVRCARGGL